MSVINSIPLIAAGDDGYQISRSVRLRSSASAYFNRTPASAGNQQKWTWSGWVKRGSFGQQQLFGAGAGTGGSPECYIDFEDNLNFQIFDGTSNLAVVRSTAVYRDPSAWYHVVVAVDTTQATAANRVLLYINGQQITSFAFSTYPTQNLNTQVNATTAHRISSSTRVSAYYFDGYLTEINFIDGQQLTPSSFGETDAVTGVWKPKRYTGTYGTNGFYLNFSDNSNNTATTIGKDSSGNGNNWTPNNISITSGSTYDSMLDTPTPYADGGNGRGNYAVLNPIGSHSSMTIAGGNLNVTSSVGSQSFNAYSSVAVSTGKWYAEVVINTGADADMIGVCPSTLYSGSSRFDGLTGGVGYYMDGRKFVASTASSYGASYTTGDVIGIALDMDAQTVAFYKNGTSQGTISSSLTVGVPYYFVTGDASSATGINQSWNFGQRPFAYTPPTGFKALNTQNLPESTIKKGNAYFDATTYTGNGSTQSIVNSGGFQPDFVWLKSRSNAFNHWSSDSVRGVSNFLSPNQTVAEATYSTLISAYNSNGFTLGNDAGGNTNAATYVGWQWKESASAGFDIVTFTAPASGNFTVNHSLGVTPAMVIVKNRNGGTANWYTWHKTFSNALKSYVYLDGTAAVDNTTYNMWGAAGHNSSTLGFTVGTSTLANANEVAYAFAEVAGFSKFGSYTGNGSADGTFVYLGFRPKFVMVKRTDSTGNWDIFDSQRIQYNLTTSVVSANTSSAEVNVSNYGIDITSNGFKLRTTDSTLNASGGTYIYAAFAENPFKNSLAR